MTHTPGPWKVEHDDTPWTEGDAEIAQAEGLPFGSTLILFSIIGGLEDEVVARCEFGMGDKHEDQERQRANARLIAAAPEMLEALGELVASLDWEEKRSGRTYAGYENAKAAIAKATGGAA